MNVEGTLKNLFSLENKTILLTGAAGGIGSVLARGMADAGGDMLLYDIAEKELNALCDSIIQSGGGATAYPMDVADLRSVKQTVERIILEKGRIDVLVNCAGINKRDGFLDVTEELYDRIMAINLKGAYFLSQAVAKHMMKAKKGSIINVSSHNAVGMLGGCSVYGATKSALTALTRSMAVEWSQYGIRANAIAPGHILTPLTQVTWDNPARADYLTERIAMRRPGAPEELLGPVIMLASDASSYMSGMMLHVDGGCLAGGSPWPYDTQY